MVIAVSTAELTKVWLKCASFQAWAKFSQRIGQGSASGLTTICAAGFSELSTSSAIGNSAMNAPMPSTT